MANYSTFHTSGSEVGDPALKELVNPEQEASLEQVCDIRSAEIQQIFKQIAQHIHVGGRMQGKIVKNKDFTHTAWVYLLPLNNTASGEPQMLRIVCCDANCGNWDWGCND